MFKLFLLSVGQFLTTSLHLLMVSPGVRVPLRRRLLALGVAPVFALLQAAHWLGFLVDEVLFRGDRRVVVRRPLFIVGPPRSGTTFLHRQLSADPRFTTFSTWECLFAPSVTERKIWMALARFDRTIGRPADRLLTRLTQRVSGGLEAIHSVTLTAPEEDYLVFLPVFACFILVVGAPHAEAVWQMGHFDRELAPEHKRQLMAFYRRCLQKHLFVHGADKTLLSKNASFPPLIRSLIETFPDARVICTMRDPMEVVPSQLSAVRPGLWGLDRQTLNGFDERMIEVLRFHYHNLFTVLAERPPWQQVIVSMARLKGNPVETVAGIYRRLEIPMDAGFMLHLEKQANTIRSHRSHHHYDLTQFGLTETSIRVRFHHAYRHYDFVEGTLKEPLAQPMSRVPLPISELVAL